MKNLLMMLFLLPLLAHAQVYKCTQNGKATYSDRPCDGQAHEQKVSSGRESKPTPPAAEIKPGSDAAKLLQEAEDIRNGKAGYGAKARQLREEAERRRSAAQVPVPKETLAEQCVDLYRPHVPYGYVRILQSTLWDGPYPTITAEGKTTRARNKFICSLKDGAKEIDVEESKRRYINDYARGKRH
ncbi:MAG: DUF4124 domain-containing protein [Zoogloeaceae bacterium]|jgi:hypothetical protein|nr:DUF4124 domain-containing protein [Zoogloeaceae bacterium]